ncbi:related to CSF1 protein [Phialocephala subalpina]|uniref:Related to CSF1 protein n=1 Tax=Phialocephala subalpina TaxID=576137 RepID=A0A1L7XBU1_9HELO|nr:related to CSF1 protein [Phialocephala subalpina]
MSSNGGLTSSPLNSDIGFNWVFLVELAVCGILTLFFLFYFNRVFAALISHGLRAWTWHKYRVYIDIQALQISLLGGRIFFKGFRYHGNNETILIHSGFITWCYWLRNVRELAVSQRQDSDPKRESSKSVKDKAGSASIDRVENGGQKDAKKLPCRLNVSLNGVEWFVYNRSAAYDAIVAGLTRDDHDGHETIPNEKPDDVEGDDIELRRRNRRPNSENGDNYPDSSDSKEGTPLTEMSSFGTQPGDPKLRGTFSTSGAGRESREEVHGSPEGAFILRFLPVHIHCMKAAVVLGNENTKSVLIAKADKASGEIDATDSSTVLDQYRQLINFQFDHPVIQMKPNDDFKEDQSSAASRIKRGEGDNQDSKAQHVHTHSFFHRQRRKAWHKLQDLVPAFRTSVESLSSSIHGLPGTPTHAGPDSSSWQGLSRYLDESEQDDKAKWSSIEYATVSTIADSPEASMSFYWDVVGTVPERLGPLSGQRGKDAANINGDTPPEWGIDLTFQGATINYGPWADRQRADIQRVFFPSLCKDSRPSKNLARGQSRVPTEFKLSITFDEETILRVPIKEESKNWKWTKLADTMGARPDDQKRGGKSNRKRKVDKGNPGPEIRPFGWFDVKVGANAAVNYTMDMVAGPGGFSNKLELDLPSTEITTSVNHGLLWRSAENRVSCDLSNPLQWNGHRTWIFDIDSNALELFILREHVFLLIDLVDDWASGPPPEYLMFTPFKYMVNLHLKDFRLYLNVNDSNIINNPSDFDDNTFIIIFGAALNAGICIPLENYRPHRNDIKFDVDGKHGGLTLHVPPWNTQATFLNSTEGSTEIATLKDLAIDGTYQYCATTSASNTDTLLLNVHGRGPSAIFYGFVIRYFLKLKDNYFGDDIRFKTLEEYQEVLRTKPGEGDQQSSSRPPHKKSNDLDVILGITADESSVILPSNLYSAKNHTRIEIATLAADLRFTNYYMDLDCVLSTLAFSQDSEDDGAATPISASSSTQLFVDGITASGNRLFGLPPTEPTYMCNWDFAIGATTGECTTEFFNRLASGGRAFAFSFDDDENALPSISEIILHDITFLRASVEFVRIWLHVDETAFLLSTGAISVNFNDWAGSHYSKKVNMLIPDLHLGCVDAESASRHRSRAQHPVETHAFIRTTLSFAMIQRKLGFEEDRQLQQEHVKRHDQRTHRTAFLLHHHLLDDSMLVPVDSPAQCVPPMPMPVVQESLDRLDSHSMKSKASSARHRKNALGRKSSFLSLSGSSLRSEGSVVRPHSSLRMAQTSATNSRSRSLQTSAGPGRRIPLRDHSTSTGRQSSFYSAVGENRGLPPSSVTFSSSYMAPYFPLEGVEPDIKDLPEVSGNTQRDPFADINQLNLDDIRPDRVDEDSAHVSFMIEFPTGVAGVFNPKAAHAVAGLLSAVQAVEPADLLDELQIDCINEISDLRKQESSTGKVVDLSVRVSEISLRFLNSSTSPNARRTHQDMLDQYDFSMSGLAITSRSETSAAEPGKSEGAQKSSVVHVALGTAALAAKERYSDIDDPQAAVHGVLEDVVFWLVQNNKTSASVAFKGFEVATNSSKLEYLASLIHRTEVLGSELAETFSSRLKQQRNRVRLFTYLVATVGQQTPDPLFLTRPSYVLRSATDHLRTTDSWKIITRLHYMYSSLDASTQHDIAMRVLSNAEGVPDDAEKKVRDGFDQWRSWDLNNINACRVMGHVYGSEAAIGVTATRPKPLKVSFRTEDVRLVLDPGPKQNEISLADITASFESTTALSTADIDPHAATQYVETMIAQVFCADVAISLNWELCELAEDILKLYHKGPTQSNSSVANLSVASDCHTSKPRRKLHVLVATDKGSIKFDTINIRAISLSEGLKASFVMDDQIEGENHGVWCLLLTAEAATSRVKSHSQELSIFQMRNPSIYATRETQLVDEDPVHNVMVAGNCQQLSFVLRQDILALVEVVDLVVGDEVLQLHRLTESLPAGKPNTMPLSTPPAKTSTPTKINIALFLDMYHISIPLLHSLTYNISGVVARASVAAQLGSEIIFDFDVKENAHDIQTVVDNKPKSISLLQLPPTNGRVTSHMSDEENTVSIIASVEPIELDAAAVHSLLTALNRPEISSVISDVQEDLKLVQSHIEEAFGPTKKPKQPTSQSRGTPLIYDAHFTLAGFDIFANAQGQDGTGNSARLDLNLGCIQLVLANRLELDGPVLEFPELRVSLRQIMFELSRWNNGLMEPCGNLAFAAHLTATTKVNDTGSEVRSFHLNSDGLEINLFADTASSVVDVVGHLQDKIKDLDLSREKQYLRKLRKSKPRIAINEEQDNPEGSISGSSVMFASMYSLELLNINVSWLVGTYEANQSSHVEKENLVLSLKRIDLSTRKENAARLTIEDLQLQMVPASQDKAQRSLNSALLPEVIFNVGFVSTVDARRLAFQAAGKSLDLRLTSQFMIPASALQKSITSASEKLRAASATWSSTTPGPSTETTRRQPFFGKKRMESLLVDADFAGAVVYLSGKKLSDTISAGLKPSRAPQAGKYGQFTHTDASSNTVLRAPGLAWKIEYKDSGLDDPSLNAEVKVDASTNILYPSVVPLIMEISSTVKEVVSEDDENKPLQPKASPQKFMSADEDNILTADPSAVLGRTRLNLGLRICRQEFSLSCQPIARVAATARFDDIYITINTVRSTEHGHFFAASAAFTRLQASVQHVYSRESTGSFDVETVFLSLMNSKHVSGTSGLSAILKISPMKVLVNAKQLQDFLLFREIWVPLEIRQSSSTPAAASSTLQSQTFLVQRYQQVAATGAFPWNATVSIAELDVQLDLGQAIGKSAFMISNFWISSKKNSDWEQNLCLGFDKMGVDSTGRMSGFVALQDFKVRTSIQWPAREMALNQTPLVQGSLGFSQLRVKAAFDYQAFLVADITSFRFLMYNVRNSSNAKGDRLVAILDGEAVQVFCTTTSAAQGLALYQAFQRLVQEKRTNYEASLSEIERYMKRKSVAQPVSPLPKAALGTVPEDKIADSPISLHTDVIVTLKAVNMGAFPSTFSDHQVFKLEALDAQARFAVTMDQGKIHSILGLTLGQLRIGLAGVKKVEMPKSVGEISVEDVVSSATGSRGGTILKVPKVEATMQTWQIPGSNHIDYIFKSSFEGKVEVGWNYSRIGYIRGMWATHSKALAQRLGKPLPPSAVKITGVPDEENSERKEGEQQKITAEVNVPQSKYDYSALEPPIIETPQLRDMGEATPPLEWIGLHRDRLPNLTHQIVIVTLLEVASEVEDAYAKILGSS